MVLLDRRVVRVHRNGLSRTFAQRVVQVLSERGAEENKEFAVHYTPGREEVDIRQARVYRRNARGELTTLEATDRSDEDLSEPWYGLYYDNRAEVVRFEGLRPGDVVEIQYLVDDVGSDNQMADYFGDLQFIGETIPEAALGLHADRAGVAPDPRQRAASCRGSTGRSSVEGSDRVYRFAAKDIAKIDAEPAMPGVGEISPYLHVSTYASWNDVGAWYWRLVEESLIADDEVRRTARGLVKRGMTDAERVRAVYDFVVKSTRYVGPRVRHPRLQALQGHAGAGAALRRLQGQGGADDRAAARGRRPARSWSWCARGGAATSTPSRRRWRSSITRSSTCPSWIATWTGRRSSPGWRAAGAGPGRRGAAGRSARQRADADAGAAVERQPRASAAGRWRWRRRATRASTRS